MTGSFASWKFHRILVLMVAVMLVPLRRDLGAALSEWTTFRPLDLGLPADEVTALHQDDKGRIWIGTPRGGIAVFDGVNWTPRHVEFPTPFVGVVEDIATDSQERAWAIIGNDLWRYEGGIWKTFEGGVGIGIADKTVAQRTGAECWNSDVEDVRPEVANGVPFVSGEPIDLAIDDEDRLWIAARRSDRLIYRFDGSQVACWDDPLLAALDSEDLYRLHILPQGQILAQVASLSTPLLRYDGEQWSAFPRLPPDVAYSWLTTGPTGVLWVGAQFGVFRYESGTWGKVTAWSEDRGYSWAIAADNTGGAWVVIRQLNDTGSLLHVQESGVEEVPYPDKELIDNQTEINLLVDRDNNLWLGDSAGLHRYAAEATVVGERSWAEVKANRAPPRGP